MQLYFLLSVSRCGAPRSLARSSNCLDLSFSSTDLRSHAKIIISNRKCPRAGPGPALRGDPLVRVPRPPYTVHCVMNSFLRFLDFYTMPELFAISLRGTFSSTVHKRVLSSTFVAVARERNTSTCRFLQMEREIY